MDNNIKNTSHIKLKSLHLSVFRLVTTCLQFGLEDNNADIQIDKQRLTCCEL